MNINEPIYISVKEIHFSRMHIIFVLASEAILELLPTWSVGYLHRACHTSEGLRCGKPGHR